MSSDEEAVPMRPGLKRVRATCFSAAFLALCASCGGTPTDVRDLVVGAWVSRGPAYSIDTQMGEDTLIIKDDGSFRLRELTLPTGDTQDPGIVVLSESGAWLISGDTVFLEGSSPDTHSLQIRQDGTLQGQLLAEFRATQGGTKMWRKVKSSGLIGISPPCPDKSGCP